MRIANKAKLELLTKMPNWSASRRLARPLLGFASLAAFTFTGVASADIIMFGGAITQSPQDTGNQAQNNPSLNQIQDGDAYTVTLNYNGSIHSPGTYTNFLPPTPCSLTSPACFNDPAAGATETSFASVSLTIIANADNIHDDLSVLACLTTGSGCDQGNQLDANFQILAADLNSQNALAVGLDQPHPLDLLEDDGVTDIHGNITSYSYTSQSPVPEPSYLALLGLMLAVVAWRTFETRSGSN